MGSCWGDLKWDCGKGRIILFMPSFQSPVDFENQGTSRAGAIVARSTSTTRGLRKFPHGQGGVKERRIV